MLRSEIERDSEEGRIANNLISKGNLVPDDLIIGLLKKKIESSPSRTGYIFDGFPRTVAQAEALDKMLSERGEKVNVLLDLEVNEKILIERFQHPPHCQVEANDVAEILRWLLRWPIRFQGVPWPLGPPL